MMIVRCGAAGVSAKTKPRQALRPVSAIEMPRATNERRIGVDPIEEVSKGAIAQGGCATIGIACDRLMSAACDSARSPLFGDVHGSDSCRVARSTALALAAG